MAKSKDILRDLSFGKYPGSLYLKGKLQYSTVFGGIVTLIIGAIVIAYAAVQIRNTFYGVNNLAVQYTVEDLLTSESINHVKLVDF